MSSARTSWRLRGWYCGLASAAGAGRTGEAGAGAARAGAAGVGAASAFAMESKEKRRGELDVTALIGSRLGHAACVSGVHAPKQCFARDVAAVRGRLAVDAAPLNEQEV